VASCGQTDTSEKGAGSELLPGLIACGLPDGPVAVFWGTDQGVGPPSDMSGAPQGADIWSITAEGQVAQITDDERSFEPRLSPDGERLYFTRGPGGILGGGTAPATEAWVRDLATGEERLLLEMAESDIKNVSGSPNGNMLAFTASATGEQRVYLLDITAPGAEPTLIPLPPDEDGRQNGTVEPAWDLQGRRLAYLAYETRQWVGRSWTVRVFDLETRDDVAIYQPDGEPPSNLRSLDWSADGRSVHFIESAEPVDGAAQGQDVVSISIENRERNVVARDVTGYGVAALTADGGTLAAIGYPGERPSAPVLTVSRLGEVEVKDMPVRLSYADVLHVARCAIPGSDVSP